jgi:hypothetical protein
VSCPIFTSLLAVGVSALLGGFDISMRGIMINFLLDLMSNVLSQYASDVMYPAETKITDQLKAFSMPSLMPSSINGPSIDYQKPFSSIPDIGFGGFGRFSGFY